MKGPIDPFRHHPGLRDLVTDPQVSFFRNFSTATLDAKLAEMGLPSDWRYTDAHIEQTHAAFLSTLPEGPLWVFGYGSLLWDPGFSFDEVRRATVPGVMRSFCLRDTLGGRGTKEAPGLMVGLDDGPSCEGLVFRIPPAEVAVESRRLWTREMIAPAYRPVMLTARTAQGEVPTLGFVADHAADMIDPDIPYEDQVRFAATGVGFLGTSRAYLENIADHFEAFGIEDPVVTRLLRDVRAYGG